MSVTQSAITRSTQLASQQQPPWIITGSRAGYRWFGAVLDLLQGIGVDCGNQISGTYNSGAAQCDLCHSAQLQLVSYSAVLST